MRCKKESGYWFEVIFGVLINTFLVYVIYIGIGLQFTEHFEKHLPLFFLIVIPLLIYFQWDDDNLKEIKTQLKIEENRKIISKVLRSLKWKAKVSNNVIEIIIPNHIMSIANIKIIIENEKIYYNFKYSSFLREGRPTFFFFICSILKWKFEKELKVQLEIFKENHNNIEKI